MIVCLLGFVVLTKTADTLTVKNNRSNQSIMVETPKPVEKKPTTPVSEKIWVCDEPGALEGEIVGTPETGYSLVCKGVEWVCDPKPLDQDGQVTLTEADCRLKQL